MVAVWRMQLTSREHAGPGERGLALQAAVDTTACAQSWAWSPVHRPPGGEWSRLFLSPSLKPGGWRDLSVPHSGVQVLTSTRALVVVGCWVPGSQDRAGQWRVCSWWLFHRTLRSRTRKPLLWGNMYCTHCADGKTESQTGEGAGRVQLRLSRLDPWPLRPAHLPGTGPEPRWESEGQDSWILPAAMSLGSQAHGAGSQDSWVLVRALRCLYFLSRSLRPLLVVRLSCSLLPLSG